MKYLVTVRRRDGVPVPPDAVAGMPLAQRDWIQERIDDGTFDVGYTFAQGGGGIAIVNADSGEELSQILTSSPVFAITNIEVQPLADASALENAAHALQRATATPA
jgi:muconolactone delta-isomerase